MNIKTVPRKEMNIMRGYDSIYKPLLDEVRTLVPGGNAIQVEYASESELNSMRNYIYAWIRQTDRNIRTSKHPTRNTVYIYEDE